MTLPGFVSRGRKRDLGGRGGTRGRVEMHGQVWGPARAHHHACCPKSSVACGGGVRVQLLQPERWAPGTQTSESCHRCLELEAFLLGNSLWRSDPAKAARAAEDALRCPRAQPPHPRSCSKSEGGLRVRVASMRVQISRPSGPRTTPRGLSGGCVHTADAPAIRAPRTLGATRLEEERQASAKEAPLPTPRQ